jgi:4'-phosphopantetheinyl transferase
LTILIFVSAATVKGTDSKPLKLDSQTVDLWLAPLDSASAWSRPMLDTLSTDEVERAEDFCCANDSTRFITTRGILRELVSRYLGCSPVEVQFEYQLNGKPQLGQARHNTKDLRFNLSHCATAALYAFSGGREVGVDIELIVPQVPFDRLATRFFTRGEIAKLQLWPVDQRTVGFFTCWTRKEAYAKAQGQGLSLPFDSFEVSAAPWEAPELVAAPDVEELERWSLWDIPLDQSLAGALAAEGRPRRLRLFHYYYLPRR